MNQYFYAAGISVIIAVVLVVTYVMRKRGIHTFVNSNLFSLSSKSNVSFNVLQYNVQLDPTIYIHEGVDVRAEVIPDAVSKINGGDIDAITFCEGFVGTARETLIRKFKELGWGYATAVVNKPSKPSNGGIFIVSKWPIIATDQHVYSAGTGSDALAAKGVMYARIKKHTGDEPLIVNLFATHLQAWYKPKDVSAREDQMKELLTFVNSHNISKDEPVIYAGDFNTDNIKYPEQVDTLVRILNADRPNHVGAQRYTSDPSSNNLVGQDGAAKDNGCETEYYCATCYACKDTDPGVCSDKCKEYHPTKPLCACCPKEYLDYVLWNKSYQNPAGSPTVEVIALKSPKMLKFPQWHLGWTTHPNFCTNDLSDHYPVLAKFSFKTPTAPPQQLFGCKNDNDCSFKWGYCYCTGPGCTVNGKRVDGFKLGKDHPINKNCHFSGDFKCHCAHK